MPRSNRFDLITNQSIHDDSDLADQMAGIFSRLAGQLREARLLRRENEALRDENDELRATLSECVESCGRYLAPTLESEVPEDADRVRAERSLVAGRTLLTRTSVLRLSE